MTREEIVKEAQRLPLAERRAAVEEITNSIQVEAMTKGTDTDESHPIGETSLEEKLAAFHRIRGMLKTEGPPPTDEDLKEDYINYLAEKYS